MSRVLLVLAVASVLAVGIGSHSYNQRQYAAGRFLMRLDGAPAGFLGSMEGGAATADVIVESLEGNLVERKRPGNVKYEDITVECGVGMSKALYEWISASMSGKASRKDGAIVAADFDYKKVSSREFFGALITEIGFPALDGASKDPAYMKIKITPEQTRSLPGDGRPIGGTINTKQKKWLSSNFRFNIGGLEEATGKVSKVEALTIKQKVTESPAGGLASYLSIGNLKITLPAADAAPFYDWFDDFVIKGNNGSDREKGGSLEYLTPDLKETLFKLTFRNLGIFKVAPDKSESGGESIRRVTAELYCEEMRFDYSPGAASE